MDSSSPLAVMPAEAAKLLGVSRSKIHRMLEEGVLASVCPGRTRLIPIRELERFLAEGPPTTQSDSQDGGS